MVLSRSETLESAAATRDPIDVLVLGGGIVGAGVARDAAMRGLRAVLVEQGDLASGTSSRSSRLLHGGLRYLAQGRLGLVRQANAEKKTIQRIAPHLVQPQSFIFPAPRQGQWPLWKLRLGVRLYDWLGGGKNFGASGGLGKAQLADRLPDLRHDLFCGAVRYFDAMTDDARLVVDTCRSAAAHGAVILNYVRATSVQREGDVWAAELHDRLGEARLVLLARAVVNSCGPWADRWPASACRLRLTKGVHLVVDRARLPVPEAVVLADGHRILFVLPWGERLIIGTTDTQYEGDPGEPPCDAQDVQYLLDAVNHAFVGAHLQPPDVLSTWAGVRPLVWTGRGGPSEIPRHHHIHSPQPGWFDMTGGKLTTYRLMAEHAVKRLAGYLGRTLPPCATAARPLLPDIEAVRFSGVLPPAPSEDCVRHCCMHEWAVHLEDVMVRRTSWSRYHADRRALAEQVASWMGTCLGWDADRRELELDRYRALVEGQLTSCRRIIRTSC